MSMTENEIRTQIQELNIVKQELSRNTDTQIRGLYLSLQEIEEAKAARYADKTLQMKDVSTKIMELALSINARGKWDIWVNLPAHVDKIEVGITRRGNYMNKLYESSFYYRFDPNERSWRTVEIETKNALSIIDVLSDFFTNNDPERHLKD